MLQQLNEIDHRWGVRFCVDIAVHVSVQSLSGIDGRIRDLSLSGALLLAKFDLRVHSLIEVSFLTPTWPRPLPVKAYVTRKQGQEVGVEWCEFAHGTVKEQLRVPAIRLVSGGH